MTTAEHELTTTSAVTLSTSSTMKALVYHGPGKRAWEDKPRPTIQDPGDALVAENASIGHCGQIALQNVKIGSANCRSSDPHDGIARLLDSRARLVLPCTLARTVIDQRFHVSAGA